MNEDIKIYEIKVDMMDEDTGMLRNSFVDHPAVEYTKLDFNKQETKTKTISFSQDSQQKFMSVSMVADRPIARLDVFSGEVYGIVFTKESIRDIVNKFVVDGNINEVSFQHTEQLIDGVYLVEHFITKEGVVEAPAFKDLPYGSWVTTYYVPDTQLYNKLKADETFNGFSIEISATLDEMFSTIEEDKLYDEIETILESDNLSDEQKEIKIKDILGID